MPTRSADVLRAAVAGLLLAFSFPRLGHPALAWIALTPLLAALCAGRLRHAFLLGLLTGGIYFTGTLYWITRVMVVYGGLQGWIAVPVNAALIAYLALFPGLFALVVRRLTMAHGPAALMAAPLVWVATELGRNYPWGGFPWVLLGYSQVTVLPIAQLASIFGVHGVSMLVASVSTALAMYAMDAGGGTAEAVPYVHGEGPGHSEGAGTTAYVGRPFRGASRWGASIRRRGASRSCLATRSCRAPGNRSSSTSSRTRSGSQRISGSAGRST